MNYKILPILLSVIITFTQTGCGDGGSGGSDYTPPVANYFITLDERSATSISMDLEPKYGVNITYKVFRDGGFVDEINDKHFVDSGLTPDTNYTYQYSVVDSGSESAMSPVMSTKTRATATTAPLAPSNLAFSVIEDGLIGIRWADESSNEEGFRVWLDGMLADTIPVGYKEESSPTGLTADTNYLFEVAAYNSIGESPKVSVNLMTLHPNFKPAMPTNLSASATSNSITLGFTDNATNEYGYRVNVIGYSGYVYCDGENITTCGVGGLQSNTQHTLEIAAFTITQRTPTVEYVRSSDKASIVYSTSP